MSNLRLRLDFMADPFMPPDDAWAAAPEWAHWHAIDEDGTGHWFDVQPVVEEEYYDHGVWYESGQQANTGLPPCALYRLDWRNSLRHKPRNSGL